MYITSCAHLFRCFVSIRVSLGELYAIDRIWSVMGDQRMCTRCGGLARKEPSTAQNEEVQMETELHTQTETVVFSSARAIRLLCELSVQLMIRTIAI